MVFKKIFLIVLIISSAIMAQPQNEIKLNLEESIIIALENNSDLKQIKLDYDKAKEQVWESYGTSLFSSIDGNISYQRAIKQGVIIIETPFFSGSFPQGTKNTLTGSITFEQPLFTGAMFLATRIAETYADLSKENVEYTKSDLVTKVKESYYNVLLAQELVKLGKLNLELAEKNLKDTESMYNAGLSPEYDLLKAKVNYQNLIPALTEVENQFKLSKNNLKIFLGLDLSQSISVVDSLQYSEISGI
ncbi:MAG: TolC family protein [Melioribacteraceae bacterium]|nr:MAG: TolC family protein [Melioribacteraceae bacterium]